MSSAMLKKKRAVFNPESSPMMDADSVDDQLSLRNNVFCMKVSYSFYNVILMLFGVFSVGVGVWSFFTFHRINLLFCSNYYSIACLLLITAGLMVLFFLFVIGCYGSFHDSYICWNFFSLGLMFVFLMNLAICCSVVKYKYMIGNNLLKFMWYNMEIYSNTHLNTKAAFDSMHRKGCAKTLDTSIQQQLTIIILTSSIFCFIQLIGITLSCCLVKKIKDIHVSYH